MGCASSLSEKSLQIDPEKKPYDTVVINDTKQQEAESNLDFSQNNNGANVVKAKSVKNGNTELSQSHDHSHTNGDIKTGEIPAYMIPNMELANNDKSIVNGKSDVTGHSAISNRTGDLKLDQSEDSKGQRIDYSQVKSAIAKQPSRVGSGRSQSYPGNTQRSALKSARPMLEHTTGRTKTVTFMDTVVVM